MIIDLFDETNQVSDKEIQLIEELLQHAAKMENVVEDAEVSVTFVNDSRIHKINKEYRDKDAPTDVISFAMEEKGVGEVEVKGVSIAPILGDIIISTERTLEQSKRFNHTFIRELGFLSVHGFLHLLGYDHTAKEDEKMMFQRQKEILDDYGLKR
jgi:probable rRNA maturation factor